MDISRLTYHETRAIGVLRFGPARKAGSGWRRDRVPISGTTAASLFTADIIARGESKLGVPIIYLTRRGHAVAKELYTPPAPAAGWQGRNR